MIDATKEEMAMIRAMSDADLLAQLNGCDPYDDEFRRRFIALAEERDALVDEAEGAAAIIAAERAEVLKLREQLATLSLRHERALLQGAENKNKLVKVEEVLKDALKYNTAMHGGAGAYNKRIKDTIAALKGDKS